jgi:NADH-quinone oxidoreductase subunit N
MIVGTVVGVSQSNVKRLLAYSSIGHGGYLLVALVAANDVGKGAVLFYLLAYAVTNLGAFGVIAVLEPEGGSPGPDGRGLRGNSDLGDYAGLWYERPWLATSMTIFLLSLGGFPPLAGFIAKWYVFSAAIKAGYDGLAIIGVLTSVVSVFFYLRIVVMMYMTPREPPGDVPPTPKLAGAALAVSAILVFYLGILPTRVLDWAAASIGTLF